MFVITTTCANAKDAKRMARSLLKKNLAACVNISKCDSLYVWKGKQVSGKEFVLSIKTSEKKLKPALAEIRKLHKYELPAIYWEKVEAEPKFGGWINSI